MLKFPALFILLFYAGLRGLGSNNFQNPSYIKKNLSASYDYDFFHQSTEARFTYFLKKSFYAEFGIKVNKPFYHIVLTRDLILSFTHFQQHIQATWIVKEWTIFLSQKYLNLVKKWTQISIIQMSNKEWSTLEWKAKWRNCPHRGRTFPSAKTLHFSDCASNIGSKIFQATLWKKVYNFLNLRH